MKSLFQKLLSLISLLVIFAFIGYTVFWFYLASQVNKNLSAIWANQEKEQLVITGDQPPVTGFPSPPKVIFSGSITDKNGIVYAAPALIYQGFALPDQSIKISAPDGIDFSGPLFKIPLHLDNLLLRMNIPSRFPNKFDAPTLSAWQKSGGTVPIEQIKITRGSLILDGSGYITLDQNLQLQGTLTAKISGLSDLLQEMVTQKTISDKQALMAQSLINLMSHKDETGVSVINTPIQIQENGIYVGPLKVAKLPEWKWQN